jgi:hypothetical protein
MRGRTIDLRKIGGLLFKRCWLKGIVIMFKVRLTSILVSVGLLLVVACGEGGDPKNKAPIISVKAPTSAVEGTTVSLDVDASDPDGSIREISWRKTYGPDIEFNGTERFSTAVFIAPDVDEDTALGVVVEVVDDNGAVSQVFSEILITDSVKLKSIASKLSVIDGENDLMVTLQFDKEPLLNTLMDYSDNCNGGIAISSNQFETCSMYKVEQTNTHTLELTLRLENLASAVQLKISPAMVSVNDNHAELLSIQDLLNQDLLKSLNEKLAN